MAKKINRPVIPLRELPLSNNFMFGIVMKDPALCKLFLELLLEKEISHIEFITREHDISDSHDYHGIRLDVYLNDEQGTRYDVEMQTTNDRDLERRIRYYQSGIDRDFLHKGEDYMELPDSYIIFVCSFDYFKKGFALYEREWKLKGCPDVRANDGSHAIILNSEYSKGNAPKDILAYLDFVRTNSDEGLHDSTLVQKTIEALKRVRQDKKVEVAYMNYVSLVRDSRMQELVDIVKNMRDEGCDKSTIVRLTGKADTLIQKVFDIIDAQQRDEVNHNHSSGGQ